MRETASSIPDWGTGSGVLMSRVMVVRMGLVRRALVEAAERSAAMASLVYFEAVMVIDVWIEEGVERRAGVAFKVDQRFDCSVLVSKKEDLVR